MARGHQAVDFFTEAMDWLGQHAGITTSLVVLSIVLLVASLWIGRYYLISVSADYFIKEHKPLENWRLKRPALWWSLMIAKNMLGALLIAAGFVMFFTPGQGILTLLLGITLTNFPGKQRLERAIIQRPTVLKVVNSMRERAGKPPLVFE